MEVKQQQQSEQGRYSSPLNTFGTSIIEITNPKDIINVTELKLRGAYINSEGKTLFDKKSQLLNEIGIRKVIAYLDNIIARNTTMSNLEGKEIDGITMGLIRDLTRQLMLNRHKWGIKNSEDRTTILWLIIPAAYICLKRPHNQGERGFWKNQIGEHVIHNQRVGEQGRSFWGKIWGKPKAN